ncbi:UNVERIFIED_CONTAM: hypothetical protein K2H54_059113 [Gekko kuhli]
MLRFRHLQEALQNQRAILENVTAKVEEKKSAAQVSAKQIEDRLFEVKHLQRKVENQIKMAKMVLISEINKRTNVLLEQLERITSERKQKLEQQLQGIMVLNRQFEHVQNFLSWAVCSKNSVPFLFSKELTPVHCPTPVCCTHCLNIPHMNKGQLPHQAMGHPQAFRQPPETQQHQPHFPLQYSLQQHDRDQRCTARPLKTMPPCLEARSHQEPETISTRIGKHAQEQAAHQAAHSVYPLPLQEAPQSQAGHSQQGSSQSPLQTPTVQVHLSPLQKARLHHMPQPQEPPPPPPQLSPPPPPPTTGQNEKAHEQAIQQSLDLMHHQFELEEMKKDLELLLQAQQPSLQLNQAKQPQHVQQTIVGQINYIVRQPGPVQQQSQDEVQQVSTLGSYF